MSAWAAAVVTIVVGFAIAAIVCAIWLPAVRRLQFGQHAYEDAPQTHQTKSGTPTTGGVAFVVALLPLLFYKPDALGAGVFFVVAACGAIGFADDYLSIRRGKNLGLRARTKLLLTALVAVIFLREIAASHAFFPRETIFHTASYALTVPFWLWLLLGICAIVGTIHAVNLTDGLDGLATGTVIPPAFVFGVLGVYSLDPSAAMACFLTVGAALAFLLYNRHPAKLFMGDTGSLALGALLSAAAILSGEMLLLLLVGAVFVAEALSVMLQVAYFKLTRGKRIFRMSPLHHHFELAGWRETAVTQRFWLASLLCSAIGWAVAR